TIDRAAKETQAVQNAGSVRPWQRVSDARRYTVLGTLAALRVIRTKKGDEMAFADLQDYYGTINLTFFSKTWQDICRVATLTDGEIYAFKGHVDISREPPSFIVDAFEPLESLHMRAVQEVHVELERGITTAHDIVPLKDFLFGKSGACTVYFHIDTETGPYIVKGNTQLMVASDSGTIHELKDLPFVKDVWTA
ncbi:MAG: DNA polymerase III subunit alpha, partial [Treponema sp.]|nr:DNA polymerase III subunit alpha [Treponema sp.]